jgi:hypothetical protein
MGIKFPKNNSGALGGGAAAIGAGQGLNNFFFYGACMKVLITHCGNR